MYRYKNHQDHQKRTRVNQRTKQNFNDPIEMTNNNNLTKQT